MQNCYNTTMEVFIRWFLKEEDPPENWNDIHSEYIGLRENKSSLFILGLVKEITYYKSKYNIVQNCCKVINACFITKLPEQADEIKKILRQYGYRQQFPMDNEMLFSRDVRAVLSLNKKNIGIWERKEREYAEYIKRHGGKEWQRKDFYMWATALSEFQGYHVNLTTIFVAEWCMLMNRYEKYCEVKEAEAKGKQYGKRR